MSYLLLREAVLKIDLFGESVNSKAKYEREASGHRLLTSSVGSFLLLGDRVGMDTSWHVRRGLRRIISH